MTIASSEFVGEITAKVESKSNTPTLPPGTTLRDIIKTLPPEVFVKNTPRAWLGVAFSLLAVGLGYASIAFAPWYLLPLAWIFTGTALTGFFVLGHDCGHRSFSPKLWVNDLVGHVLFLPLLYPFHPWRIMHDRHHNHTNKLGEDNAWYPFTAREYAEIKPYERFFYRLIRGRFWWIGSIIHWAVLHFDASIYPERQRSQVRFSAGLVIAYAAIAFPLIIAFGGIAGWVNFFLMPWLVYHFWMSTFTIVHHTMPDIQFKEGDRWNAAQDQLTGTVHCDYPAWVEWLCHDINVHIPHHISTAIPFYNLRKAHKSLQENWGEYLYTTKFSWELMKQIGDKCHIYDEQDCYRSFKQAGF
ncbi:fatty acid desaturase [Pseudanabaena sp. PCC 6802]|uniref:fatty acid desaturase n=1 Tax=Pseudanabaena sp. PCC 6802 TaxID=118173 RepID=UPI000348D60B|nr:fatty acid desaturase [Pseudanabaena sp. PCC 6802]